MAVFRVERTSDYTVMSNYHLRDKRLSLKAKGLLSQRLTQITQSLKPLRRDIRLCRQITEQSVQMQKRLRQREESCQNTERNPAHEPDRKTNPTR